MKLEFEHESMAEGLSDELGFEEFLGLFNHPLPILPSRILRPMTRPQGEAYYRMLAELAASLVRESAKELLDLSGELPLLDALLPHLETGQLEQYHLFDLGRFLQADRTLHTLEKRLGLTIDRHPGLEEMLAVLARWTGSGFSQINLSEQQTALRLALNQAEAELADALLDYEKRILTSTGLKMIYPWPKEIALTEDALMRLKTCALITTQQREDLWRIDYRPDACIQNLVARRDRLSGEFKDLLQASLAELNRELAPLSGIFAHHYRTRRERSWSYLLILTMKEHRLCLPRLVPNPGCRLIKATLPSLKMRKRARCVPLDLTLKAGANVLYGAHMSGKTTALKTAFFILTLVRFGLPVPAEDLELHFPENLFLLLRSSGNITSGTSTFGGEIAFFSQPLPDGAFVLVDELFSSTDPVHGTLLSEIFISEFNRRQLVFFCSSHYPHVRELEGINLLRMQDIDPRELAGGCADIQVLQERMPYRLEIQPGQELPERRQTEHVPLEIALLYPLPAAIQQRIRQVLKP